VEVSGQLHALATSPPGKDSGTQSIGVWRFWRGEKVFAPVRNQTLDCTAHSLITIDLPSLVPSPDITIFVVYIVVFELTSSFLAIMAAPVSVTTCPVHSEVFDCYHSSLCRSCRGLLVCLNRDFWRQSTVCVFLEKDISRHYFFLSKIKQKGTAISDSTLEKRIDIFKLYWSV
jgi:hypothetical protein